VVPGDLDRIAFEHTTRNPVPLCELRPVFETLRSRGLAIGIATMDSSASLEATLTTLNLHDLVDFHTGYDGGHGSKPGPGMVLGFCAATGLSPSEVAVVGDTLHDLRMARAAGAGLAIAVTTGTSPYEMLEPESDWVLDTLTELLD
jgi:phosphoglycolate phosphatase